MPSELASSADTLELDIAPAFDRDDDDWTLRELAKTIVCTIFLFPIRLCLIAFAVLVYYLIVRVAAIGLSEESLVKRPLHKNRRRLINTGRFFGRIILCGLGFYKIKISGSNKISTSPENNGTKANLYVVNHTSYVDILALLCTTDSVPSYVAKKSMEKVSLIGFISRVWQCIYVERLSHKEGAGAVLKERATDSEMPEVVVFPEGTTSNGKSLIKFHTGGFLSGSAVKPVVLRYPYKHFSPAWESISAGKHIFRLMTQFYNNLEVTFLPIYVPSPVEKSNPELYSRKVQKMMADALRVPIKDVSYQEKVKYLRALRDGRI